MTMRKTKKQYWVSLNMRCDVTSEGRDTESVNVTLHVGVQYRTYTYT